MNSFNKSLLENLDTLDSFALNETKAVIEAEPASSDDIQVYMNTWKNYNEYGADLEMYGIRDGWMSPEQGLEFCKKYAEDEPFINDVDNCPIEVSEYDNAVEKLQELIKYDECDDKTVLKNAMETGQYNSVDDYIDIINRGDYIWFAGVDSDEELGRAYADMVGEIANKEDYFDRQEYKDEIYADERARFMDDNNIESDDDFEENYEGEFDDYLDMLADTYEEMGEIDDSYFDYEKLGRELGMDGYTFTSDGCICLL